MQDHNFQENYCLYLRKSRADLEAEEHGEGETLARHRAALLELAKRRNLNITKIFEEVVSGETIAARPVMQALLEEVSQGLWAGVLVVDVERLARGDTMDQGFVAKTFKYSATKIITEMKTYDPMNEFDEEYLEFGLFMSRREYKVINRRMQNGRIASVKEGKYVGNRPPYGYIRRKLDHEKGFTLDPHPEQAEIVKMIFELYTTGEKQADGSYRQLGAGLIARRLNDLKLSAQKGGDWTTSSVRDILINPVYIGKIRWNWRPAVKKMVNGKIQTKRPRSSTKDYLVTNGRHKALIDPAVFAKAQEILAKNPARTVGAHFTVMNPLAGLVICGKCGRRMTRRPYRGANKSPDTLLCAATSCSNVSSALYFVEERILHALQEWLKDYKLHWNCNVSVKPDYTMQAHHNALKKLNLEIAELNQQKRKICDLLERGIYDTETFLERMEDLSGRLNQAKENKALHESNLELEKTHKISQKDIIPKVEHLLKVYNALPTPKAKNDLLKEVLEKVVYVKEKNGRWHNSLDDFEITLYPKLPASSP